MGKRVYDSLWDFEPTAHDRSVDTARTMDDTGKGHRMPSKAFKTKERVQTRGGARKPEKHGNDTRENRF